jgi:hypothetical protein
MLSTNFSLVFIHFKFKDLFEKILFYTQRVDGCCIFFNKYKLNIIIQNKNKIQSNLFSINIYDFEKELQIFFGKVFFIFLFLLLLDRNQRLENCFVPIEFFASHNALSVVHTIGDIARQHTDNTMIVEIIDNTTSRLWRCCCCCCCCCRYRCCCCCCWCWCWCDVESTCLGRVPHADRFEFGIDATDAQQLQRTDLTVEVG